MLSRATAVITEVGSQSMQLPISSTRSFSPKPASDGSIAVLVSGGLDSGVLLADSIASHTSVHPIYVRCGLSWEAAELDHVRRFSAAIQNPSLRKLQVLEAPVADLDTRHWGISGDGIPTAGTPDDAVFLPGRNLFLLTKAMLWCHLGGIGEIAIGILARNPFPDATAGFFAGLEQLVNEAVGGGVRISRPLEALSKSEVVRRGHHLPLELTFSCLQPTNGGHCGVCNKCEERRLAFAIAGVADPTRYGL
jgi:7-cyano-7-deazaguanine synthase